MLKEIVILGGGPAGSAAAIAMAREGARARILERSKTRRHKVCGEFISPEAVAVLADLGVWDEFSRLRPPSIRKCILHFGSRKKQWALSESGFGLSRYELDDILQRQALASGARIMHGDATSAAAPLIVASGRRGVEARGNRLFGFKAHFEGPADDAVELFFSRDGYAGVSSVENGVTNVCGMAPERALRACDFQLDEFVRRSEPLAERLRPLSRRFEWLTTGPLVFAPGVHAPADPGVYLAGDALGFIDPFTGSGILNALLTGRLSGVSAARQEPGMAYFERCHGMLERAYRASAILRALLDLDCVGHLASLVPGQWLFRMTRVARGVI